MIEINSTIQLRPLQIADAESIAMHGNNKKIWNNVRDYFPYPYTVQDADNFIADSLKQQPAHRLGICIEGSIVGVIGINFQTDTARKSVELGYWLGETFWGKGVLTAAIPKALEYFWFNFPQLNRIFASVHHTNTASNKLLVKCGFEQEGYFKESIFKNSVFLDEYRYGLLRK